jgi:hypothetical protein
MFKQSYPVPPPTYFAQISPGFPEPVIVHLVTGLNPIPVTAVAGRVLVLKFRVAGVTPGSAGGFSEGYIAVTSTPTPIIGTGLWLGVPTITSSINSAGGFGARHFFGL